MSGGGCWTLGCTNWGSRWYTTRIGNRQWLCRICAEELHAIEHGHTTDGVLFIGGLLVLAVGAIAAAICGTSIVLEVPIDSQVVWVRWAGLAAGILAVALGLASANHGAHR